MSTETEPTVSEQIEELTSEQEESNAEEPLGVICDDPRTTCDNATLKE